MHPGRRPARLPSRREGSGPGKAVAARGTVRSPGPAPDAASLYARSGVRKYLNAAERRRFLIAAEAAPPEEACFALLLAWTGARVSEILQVTPAVFDLDRSVVALQTLKRRRVSMREVPIDPRLMTRLEKQFGIRAAQRDPAVAKHPLWPWHRATAWRIIKAIMARAGLTGPAATPRGLRHSFAIAALVDARIPETAVQRWMGHARLSTTAIYTLATGPEEIAMAGRMWCFKADTDQSIRLD